MCWQRSRLPSWCQKTPASSLHCHRTLPFPNPVSTREDHPPCPRLREKPRALPVAQPKELHPGQDRPAAHWVKAPDMPGDMYALWPGTTTVEHAYSVLSQDFGSASACTANCHVCWLPSLAAPSNTDQRTSSDILQTLPATSTVKRSSEREELSLGKNILQSCG